MTKIITIEEHYQLPHKETMTAAQQKATKGNNPTQIDELSMDFDKKIAYMDKYGISMQVLSNSGPSGAMIPDKAQAVAACQHTNDTLAAKISKYRPFRRICRPADDRSRGRSGRTCAHREPAGVSRRDDRRPAVRTLP